MLFGKIKRLGQVGVQEQQRKGLGREVERRSLEFKQKCKEWQKEGGKKGHLHGREEDAGKRARQDVVRLQDQDQSAGKCGLRMVLS